MNASANVLLQRKCELRQLNFIEPLFHQGYDIEHPFDLQDVIESGFRAGMGRREE